eukprot:940148-Rhodomonas_salina.1
MCGTERAYGATRSRGCSESRRVLLPPYAPTKSLLCPYEKPAMTLRLRSRCLVRRGVWCYGMLCTEACMLLHALY